MTDTPRKWRRVTSRQRCAICAKPNWCTETLDGAIAHCMRVVSDWPAKNGGWLHRLDGAAARAPAPACDWIKAAAEPARIDAAAMIGRWSNHTPREAIEELATQLGVSPAALTRLRACWSHKHAAWAFPMCDDSGAVIGIRTRKETGEKRAVLGSRSGLFIPLHLRGSGPLIIVEGPTDTAAVLTWGFDAIGRPSCSDGDDLILAFLKRHNRRDVVILANRDEPKPLPDGTVFYPGQRGAQVLADRIAWACKSLKVILPPQEKDARAWLRAGGTKQQVELVIASQRQWPRRRAG